MEMGGKREEGRVKREEGRGMRYEVRGWKEEDAKLLFKMG